MEALGFNIPSLIVFLVNFLLVLGILYLFAFKPILKLLDQRSERIKESLEAADRARQDAADSETRIQEQLQEARRQGQRLLEQAKEMADKFREDEMGKAREAAESFIQRAQQEIQQERDGAIEEVKTHFALLAIQAAERILDKSLDAEAHKELIDKVLQEDQQSARS